MMRAVRCTVAQAVRDIRDEGMIHPALRRDKHRQASGFGGATTDRAGSPPSRGIVGFRAQLTPYIPAPWASAP